jgi:hypothetical protein
LERKKALRCVKRISNANIFEAAISTISGNPPIAWLLTLVLRKNRAAVRYWVWLSASIEFLIPFSLLINAGTQLAWRKAPAVEQRRVSFVADTLSRPFVSAAPEASLAGVPAAPSSLPAILLLSVWFLGIAIGIIWWLRRWLHIRATQRTATLLDLNLPISGDVLFDQDRARSIWHPQACALAA